MIDMDRLKKLLGNGVHPAAAAGAVGCTPAYVSQLLALPEFAMEIAELRMTEMTKAKEIDDTIDDIEKELVEKFKDLIPHFTKPKDVLDAMVRVNAMKRKTKLDAGFQGGGGQNNIVKLTVPMVVIHNYKINMNGGMVEVEGRSLKPMPSADLLKTLEKHRRSNGEEPKLLEAEIVQSRRKNEISENSV